MPYKAPLRWWIWLRGELRCGCHWHPLFGPVVMAGCPKHD